MLDKLYENLCDHKDIICRKDEPISKHTSFKIGGMAKLFCELKSEEAIGYAIAEARKLDISPFILGNGTNILFPDEGVEYPIFKISDSEIKMNGDELFVTAGTSLIQLSIFAKENSLSGFEFAYGIPGTVGGAIVMNAGAYGSEIKDVLVESTYLDENGNIKILSADEHNFGYRESFYKENPKNVVLNAKFKLISGNREEIGAKMADILSRRRDKQPLEYPSAGSVFKRPEGYFAGALIEQSGLKGHTIGGAQVSEKHAGFIVNRGDATCEDVKKLIEYIKEKVYKDSGVTLECEVMFAPLKV